MLQMQFRSELQTRASECQYLRSYDGKPIHHTVRRIICPSEAINEVLRITAKHGFARDVVPIESLNNDRPYS